MWKQQWLSVTVVVVMVVIVGMDEVRGTPLSHQQQLRRRGHARGRIGTPADTEEETDTTEKVGDEYPASSKINSKEKQLTPHEKAAKVHEADVEALKLAFIEREKVLEEREFALDIRDSELDQRSNNIDKQILETDKRLKEREDRIAARESALTLRESEILKLAEAREQEIDRLSKERENAAELRERALEDRELALAEREKRVEEREKRVQKRMENNRKRFQRRMELRQLDQRMGKVVSASTPRGRAIDYSLSEPLTQATTNHPKRVIEKVTFRKVTSSSPTVSESTVFLNSDGSVTTSLSPDEQVQVTEAVAYESAKEYSTLATTTSLSKGENALVSAPISENSLSSSTLKKRKSGKRRARQRRQHHHDRDQEESTSPSNRRSRTRSSTSSSATTTTHKTEEDGHRQKKQRKVRKVVKKMGSDGTMVIVKHDH